MSPSKISVSSTESAKISPPKTITQDGSPRSKALPNGDSPKSSTVKSIETNEVEPKKNRFWFVSFALLVGCLLVIAVALLMEDRREQFKEVFNELKKKTAELFPSK